MLVLRPQIIEEVVLQHAEDAAFYWAQRERALHSASFPFADLERLDARLRAHLDALALAGSDAWPVMWRAWKDLLPGERFAAWYTAARLGHREGAQAALDGLASLPEPDVEAEAAITNALTWLPRAWSVEQIRRWYASGEPLLQRLAVAGLVELRQPLPFEVAPGALTHSEDPALRTAALELDVVLGALTPSSPHAAALHDPDPRVRLAAALGLWRRGQAAGAQELLMLVDGSDAAAPTVCGGLSRRRLDLACYLGFHALPSGTADRWLAHFAASEGHGRSALLGAAGLGDPVLVPWLLDQVAIPERARVCAHALETITGVPLELANLDGDPPAADMPDDELDDDMPWPDADALRRWWPSVSGHFPPGTRGLWGRPTRASLRELLDDPSAPIRLRAVASWRLAERHPGAVFPYTAPAHHQRAWLEIP